MKIPQTKKADLGWILVCSIVFLMVGCATGEKIESLPTAVPQNLVKNIALETGDEGGKVIIEGATPLRYTYFRIIPQPLKLVVDIPQAELSPALAVPLVVGDKVIKEITAVQNDGDVEVSISLSKLVKYQVQKEGNFLYIVMGKRGPLLAEDEKKSEIEIVKEMPPPVTEEVITKTLPQAKNLIDVVVDTSQKERIILLLKADGTLGDYNSFDLKKPTRLVIDLWKVKRKFGKKEVAIHSPYLKKVRLGDHPQKVRVVLDIPTQDLPSHRVDRIGSNLQIVLGKKEAVAEAIPLGLKKEVVQKEKEMVTKKEEEAKAAPPAITVTGGEITGIDFKQFEDKSRIILSTPTKAPYKVKEGPENTLLIEVTGMTVPPKLNRPLDTHEFASPVSMIIPNNVMIGSQKSAQITFKLRKMVSYDVKQEDDRIYVDFERSEEFKGEEKPKPIEVITVKQAPAEEITAEPEVTTEKEPVKKAEPVKEEKVTPPVPKAEEATLPAEGGQKVYTGKKITLDFKDADIDNILRLFAEVSDLNIITTEDVKGTVTVRLVDVPWDQAFDIILQSKNLGVERIGNVMRIAPLERIRAERKLRAEASKATEEIEPLVTELIQVSYSTAAELAPKVKDLLSSRGTVTVDERTNTLIVKDIQANLVTAKELVRMLDAQTPQVLIQAQIVEANTEFGRELGISWGGSFQDSDVGVQDTSISATGASSGDFAVDLPATVGSGAGGAVEFLIANLQNTKYLRVKLSALESTGKGRVISAPRITTLDHTEAYIEQGLRVPYVKLTDEGTATTEFIDANLKLQVTPHVTADGHIKMEILVSKDAPDYTNKDIYGTPAIDKKEAKTEVLVKDGEVVVIGGIYTYEKTGSVDAVPFFYKIPLLGWLFQRRSKNDNKRELLIFIAPRIVQPRRTVTS